MDNDLSYNEMEERWMKLAIQYGAHPAVAEKLFETIARAYSEAGRHYHTLGHIESLLDLILRHQMDAEEQTALSFAAWFHDVIYDTRRTDNEERSADFAANVLHALMVPERVAKRTAFLIARTKGHEPVPDDPNAQFFIDADLAILGAEPEEYRRYSEGIRQEYIWVDDARYRDARRTVLRNFLERERLYLTPWMFELCERQAQENLRGEIEGF